MASQCALLCRGGRVNEQESDLSACDPPLPAADESPLQERSTARGQIVTGAAMLTGTAAGGFAAQFGNLGVPYVIRAALLAVTFVVAAISMKELGFTPARSRGVRKEVAAVLQASVDSGWRNPPVRCLMLAGFCSGGVGIYAFYAVQPFLLKLYGDERAFGVAGVAAAIVSATQILSGLSAPLLRRLFHRRTHVLLCSALAVAVSLWLLGTIVSFPIAMAVLVVWSFAFWPRCPPAKCSSMDSSRPRNAPPSCRSTT
jgi:hypothetical protein